MLPVNEIFTTIQGEGPDIGKPCVFLRLHACPVQCPGCDTHYTWDGSEKAGFVADDHELRARLGDHMAFNRGIVVSGGEPLLYYQSKELLAALDLCVRLLGQGVGSGTRWAWAGLETSGYAGTKSLRVPELSYFLGRFTSVSLSPKITPCLHGRQSDEELERNVGLFLALVHSEKLFLKLVVRDQADLDAVLAFDERHGISEAGFKTYLMPYGNDRDEILKTVDFLCATAIQRGYYITPRLQSLLWGKKRGV